MLFFSNCHFVFCARKIEYRLTGTDCNTHTKESKPGGERGIEIDREREREREGERGRGRVRVRERERERGRERERERKREGAIECEGGGGIWGCKERFRERRRAFGRSREIQGRTCWRECTKIIEPDQFGAFVDRGRGDGAVGNFTTVRPPDGGHNGGGSTRRNAFFFLAARLNG